MTRGFDNDVVFGEIKSRTGGLSRVIHVIAFMDVFPTVQILLSSLGWLGPLLPRRHTVLSPVGGKKYYSACFSSNVCHGQFRI